MGSPRTLTLWAECCVHVHCSGQRVCNLHQILRGVFDPQRLSKCHWWRNQYPRCQNNSSRITQLCSGRPRNRNWDFGFQYKVFFCSTMKAGLVSVLMELFMCSCYVLLNMYSMGGSGNYKQISNKIKLIKASTNPSQNV